MEFITIKPNKSPLDKLNRDALKKCTGIDAAIAYISNDQTLIKGAIDKNIPLNIYGRYDYSEPVKISIMRKFISARYPRLSMRLVADIYHPKVIWWRNFGAYIGSANLTERGWFQNIEAGVFLTEEELYNDEGISADLEAFFDTVIDRSHALTEEIIKEIESFDRSPLTKAQKEARDLFNHKNRLIPQLSGLHDVNQRRIRNRALDVFVKEWDETLQTIRNISQKVACKENRPKWVRPDTPKGVQADQFLHAFYYNRVVDGRSHPFTEFHHKNKDRTEEALAEEIKWWKSLREDQVTSELRHMHEWAPFVREHLSKDRLLELNSDEFYETCEKIHALKNHALRIKWANHKIQITSGKTSAERIRILSDWLLEQKNEQHEGTLEVIYYVLYGGRKEHIARRIFEASSNPTRKIPHLSISTYGEMVGWALPDKFPPRNGRTSKALKALGYDVKIHSQ